MLLPRDVICVYYEYTLALTPMSSGVEKNLAFVTLDST